MVDQALAMSPAASVVSEDKGELRRGPWTAEEDVLLVNYIAKHGEGRWNSLARSAGLKRTGKSCRLRWLNYLRPDVRRGDITPAEQLLILELHARWGNRWSEIARCLLPGRTDNEVKNYWRTRVQRHAKRLRCDVSSRRFQDVVRQVWVPRLVQRVQAESSSAATGGCRGGRDVVAPEATSVMSAAAACQLMISAYSHPHYQQLDCCYTEPSQTTATAAGAMSPDDASSPPWSLLTTEESTNQGGGVVQCSGATTGPVDGDDVAQEEEGVFGGSWSELLATTGPDDGAMIGMRDFELGDFEDNLWSLEDIF